MGKAVEGHRTPGRYARRDDSLKYAKRLGLRQSSGALPEAKMFARFPHELLCANDNLNCHIRQTPGSPSCARGFEFRS